MIEVFLDLGGGSHEAHPRNDSRCRPARRLRRRQPEQDLRQMKVAKYETKGGKVTVFVEDQPDGLTFSFKSDKEVCAQGAADVAGCFTKV